MSRMLQEKHFVLILTGFLALAACEEAGPVALEEPSTSALPGPAHEVSFTENTSEPFGTFDGVRFLRPTGMFEGETSLGEFRVPYEIVAPEDPDQGNGTVLVEPPHFLFGALGRDFVLGRELVFATVSAYAAVGFGEHLSNILDSTAEGLLLGGHPVENPGTPNPMGVLDEEILVQFIEALASAPFTTRILGPIERRYAHGTSQTAAELLETQRSVVGTDHESLFDFTLLHTALWRSPFPLEEAFDFLGGEFAPITGVGRVLFVESEGDQVISDAEQFRRAVGQRGYRVYEVAGAAHGPSANNPLDHNAVARAAFVSGDRWVRSGVEPPASQLMQSAPEGQIDPVYGIETGIARDGDLNGLGGVGLPDQSVGRAQFVASDPSTVPPFLPAAFAILTGSTVDLACEPESGSDTDDPRFRNHGDYLRAFTRQVNELRRDGFLLADDAEALKERAAESEVGKPGTCAE